MGRWGFCGFWGFARVWGLALLLASATAGCGDGPSAVGTFGTSAVTVSGTTAVTVLCRPVVAGFVPDVLGDDFVQRRFVLVSDQEAAGKRNGEPLVATLVRKAVRPGNRRAVLYLHGFNDYFFQTELADSLYGAGFDFYALDLHRYGRSLLPGQAPFKEGRIARFFAEIDSAFRVVQEEGHSEIALLAHSQGGLIASLYAARKGATPPMRVLVLNSPFLDFHEKPFTEKVLIPAVALLGRLFPSLPVPQGSSTAYSESLLQSERGEWQYNTEWKKPLFSHIPACWFSGIVQGQRRVRRQLDIGVEVALFHSDKSVSDTVWSPAFQTADAVLGVEDIKRLAPSLGSRVTLYEIPGGMHDLALSSPAVRNLYYQQLIAVLKSSLDSSK